MTTKQLPREPSGNDPCPCCGALPVDQVNDPMALLSAPVMLGYAMHYGGRCRDCADEDGTCPQSGMPCGGREKATRFVCEALEYGFRKGFVDPQYARPAKPDAAPVQEAGDVDTRARELLAAEYWNYGCADRKVGLLENGPHGPAEHAALAAIAKALTQPAPAPPAREDVGAITLLLAVRTDLERIFEGDDGPVILRGKGTDPVKCARKHEAGIVLRKLIRNMAALTSGSDRHDG